MKGISEKDIELYVRFPDELNKEKYFRIQSYLSSNKEAQEIADFYKEFYTNFDTIHRPVIFELKSRIVSVSSGGPMILAAMSPEKQENRLVTKAIFGSEEESTLVRVLEDNHSRKIQFHVLSRYLGEEDRALISFANSGLELVTEKGGRLKGIEQEKLSDINWEDVMLLLRLPSSSCNYNPSAAQQHFSLCEECSFSISEGCCTAHINQENTSRILIEQGSNISLYYVDHSQYTFSIKETEPFTIHLYR